MDEGSVTRWLREVKEGDAEALRNICERYFKPVVRLARSRSNSAFALQNEEDIAVSVLARFCQAAEDGNFPNLSDRDSMWHLLICMTEQKLIDRHRYENRKRRNGEEGVSRTSDGIENVTGDSLGPEFAVMVADEIQSLHDALEKPKHREVLLGKLEHKTNEELAELLDCSVRTIERLAKEIREIYRAMNEKG